MKKIILTISAILLTSLFAISQISVKYEVVYNSQNANYEAHALISGIPQAGDYILGSSAYTITIPVNGNANPNYIYANRINPPNASWADLKPLNKNTFDGVRDYHKLVTFGGMFSPNSIYDGADIVLFTFNLPLAINPANIRVFENTNSGLSSTPDTNPRGLTYDNSFQTGEGERYFGNLSIATNIDDIVIKDNDLKLYPNPTNDYVNIEMINAPNKIQRIDIYSATGQLISRTNEYNNGSSFRYDVQNLSNGIYYVLVMNKDAVYRSEFIVQK